MRFVPLPPDGWIRSSVVIVFHTFYLAHYNITYIIYTTIINNYLHQISLSTSFNMYTHPVFPVSCHNFLFDRYFLLPALISESNSSWIDRSLWPLSTARVNGTLYGVRSKPMQASTFAPFSSRIFASFQSPISAAI